MRTLKSGDQEIDIRSSNMARFYFNQEFGFDMGEDLDKIQAHLTAKNGATGIMEQLTPQQITALCNIKDISKMTPDKALDIFKRSGLADNPELRNSILALGAQGGSVQFPAIPVMKITWAMSKAQNDTVNVATPSFDQWLLKYDDFDFEECFPDIYVEIRRGFFRSENKGEG